MKRIMLFLAELNPECSWEPWGEAKETSALPLFFSFEGKGHYRVVVRVVSVGLPLVSAGAAAVSRAIVNMQADTLIYELCDAWTSEVG